MPRTKSTYAKKRKYSKKSYKKRSRFSKKKFYKSNSSVRATIKASLMPKELFVKLPFSHIFSQSISASSAFTRAYNGTSYAPTVVGATSAPQIGDLLCNGIIEYSQFYDSYTALGASIKLTCLNYSGNSLVRICLIPVTTAPNQVAFTNTMGQHITELDAMDFQQLSSQPGCQVKTLGLNSGGSSQIFMKSFRKTKGMLAIKDIRDQPDLKLELPKGLTVATAGNTAIYEDKSWFYYIRAFNMSTTNAQVVEFSVRMKYYFMLSGRLSLTQDTTIA